MTRRQKLGQHFLISNSVAKSIVDAAKIKNKVVLEIGTGRGILTPLLCKKAKKVISIEADKSLYENAKKEFDFANLNLKCGDGFKSSESFEVFVSNLPYSKSKKAIEWLIQKRFSHGIVMVQKEFAQKLAESGKNKRAISVLANYGMNMEKIMDVNKNNFEPKPKVDSVVLRLEQKKRVPKEIIQAVNGLYSYKRKTISNILKKFGKKTNSSKRLEDLSGDEIIKIAKQIIKWFV